MTTKHIILFIAAFALLSLAQAQNKKVDSAAVASTLKSLLSVCRNVDFADPKTNELGMFYKAAPYIIYQGNDKKRAWKVFANYNNAEDKKGVDAVCTRINETVNRDSSYQIVKYFTKTESEGKWHLLMVSYKKMELKKKQLLLF